MRRVLSISPALAGLPGWPNHAARATMPRRCAGAGLSKPGQAVRVNLAGLQVGDVLFHAAVTAAAGLILRQTSENPPKYLEVIS